MNKKFIFITILILVIAGVSLFVWKNQKIEQPNSNQTSDNALVLDGIITSTDSQKVPGEITAFEFRSNDGRNLILNIEKSDFINAEGSEITYNKIKVGDSVRVTTQRGDIFLSSNFLKPSEIKIIQSTDNSNKSGVIISTDKTEYNKGEIIKIVVNNKLDKSVLYSSGGDRFWNIEYFRNGKWTNPGLEEGGGFQLAEKNVGENCYIALYERTSPVELKAGSNLSSQWSQKICPFDTSSPAEPRTVKYIESDQYRLAFIYGFEVSKDDPYKLSDFQTVYSNAFTIK